MRNIKQNSFASIHRQRGWTFWSLSFVGGVVILFAYIGMQLVPVYIANNNIINAMERSMDDADLRKIGRAFIIRKMKAQLYLDGTYDILDYKKELRVRRSKTKMILETKYEREVPLFFNVALIVRFDNNVERNLN
ncbi:MAG: DUF4845 domain-containing protein [Gammaproteobacteria bacterium]|nr:DUF4845 domain-containing protein [Gammaproteobacteria bacterium]